MRGIFCQLIEAESGDIVYVNPLLVRTFRSYGGDKTTTHIEFDENHKLLVKLTSAQVAQSLNIKIS